MVAPAATPGGRAAAAARRAAAGLDLQRGIGLPGRGGSLLGSGCPAAAGTWGMQAVEAAAVGDQSSQPAPAPPAVAQQQQQQQQFQHTQQRMQAGACSPQTAGSGRCPRAPPAAPPAAWPPRRCRAGPLLWTSTGLGAWGRWGPAPGTRAGPARRGWGAGGGGLQVECMPAGGGRASVREEENASKTQPADRHPLHIRRLRGSLLTWGQRWG